MELAEPLVDAIKAFVASGEDALGPAYEASATVAEGDVVGRIRRILEEQVRPAVAMDGGDVVFAGYSDGVVEVHLQGSCAGAPARRRRSGSESSSDCGKRSRRCTKVVSV